MEIKKTVSLVTASALLLGSLSGCSLLGGKDKAAVGEAVTGYIEAIQKGKLNNSKKFVVDEEDYFQENELDGTTAGILDAVWSVSEFEIGDVEIKNDSATVEVEFTLPDLESIADEGYSYDEFIDAIADIDDTVEETFEFELSKDGDDWLIEGDSTEDFYNFLTGLTEDLEFSGLSESAALEAVDTFIGYLASGSVYNAVSMSNSFEEVMNGYAASFGEDQIDGTVGAIMAVYFSNLDYELEVTETTEDSMTVTVTGTAPDAETAVNEIVNDPEALAPVVADYIEAVLNGTLDEDVLMGELFDVVASAIFDAPLIPYSSYAVVTVDDEGNYLVDPDSEFMATFEFPGFMDSSEVIPIAMDLLLEQGRITQEQYDELMGDTPVSGDYDVTDLVVSEGDDFYNYNVFVTDDMVSVHVQTWDYYDAGDRFGYQVIVNGSSVVSGEYVIPTDNCDMIYIDIPAEYSGPYGNYVITVFDEGVTTSTELCTIEVIVLEQGAPIMDHSVSIEIEQEGDDYYSCHSECIGDEIDIYVTTWDYYDAGTEFNYVITYYSGTMEMSIGNTYVMPSNNCDSVVISLPSVDGEFPPECAITIYDANADFYSDILAGLIVTVD